jgi:hypothetical protein
LLPDPVFIDSTGSLAVMSIFKSILAKIFPSDHPAVVNPPPAQQAGGAAAPASAPASAPAAMPPVDIEQILGEKAKTAGQPLNWKTSIVDLMKLVGLDSSLDARKQLAQELGYTGDRNDSATMNVWLHRQVMKKLAENGGKVPADLH